MWYFSLKGDNLHCRNCFCQSSLNDHCSRSLYDLAAQLTCLPSWPTLVWPLTTVLMLSSRRLSCVTQNGKSQIEGKLQKTCVIKSLTSTHRIFSRILLTTSSILAKDWGETQRQDIRKTWRNHTCREEWKDYNQTQVVFSISYTLYYIILVTYPAL